jgi:hypothetical protein
MFSRCFLIVIKWLSSLLMGFVPSSACCCYIESVLVRWVPCHHSTARPRIADGGTASSYGG